MKNKIILSSMFATILLLTLPSISSVELEQIKDAVEQDLICELKNYSISELRIFLNGNLQKVDYNNFVKKLNKIYTLFNYDLDEDTPQPQCIMLFLFMYVVFNTISKGITFVVALINAAIDFFGLIIAEIMSLALVIVRFILKVFVVYLIAYFVTAAIIDISVLCLFLLLMIIAGG